MSKESFAWDPEKDSANQLKHGVSFAEAQFAFGDPHRVIVADEYHSEIEQRHFCLGKVGAAVITVRFTYRNQTIRIIGAGYWRKGRKIYEQENQIH